MYPSPVSPSLQLDHYLVRKPGFTRIPSSSAVRSQSPPSSAVLSLSPSSDDLRLRSITYMVQKKNRPAETRSDLNVTSQLQRAIHQSRRLLPKGQSSTSNLMNSFRLASASKYALWMSIVANLSGFPPSSDCAHKLICGSIATKVVLVRKDSQAELRSISMMARTARVTSGVPFSCVSQPPAGPLPGKKAWIYQCLEYRGSSFPLCTTLFRCPFSLVSPSSL